LSSIIRAYAPKFLAAALAALAIVLGVAPLAHAQAATAQPAIIGMLDVARILHESKAAQSANVALDRQRTIYESQLSQQQNAIQAAGQQLQQQEQSGALGTQDVQKKRLDLQQRFEALKKEAATRRKQLGDMEEVAAGQVLAALRQIVGEIAKTRGMNLVIDKAAVKASAPSFEATNDITQEALLKLNARLPSIKLTAPK
jgi:outer membrane protein